MCIQAIARLSIYFEGECTNNLYTPRAPLIVLMHFLLLHFDSVCTQHNYGIYVHYMYMVFYRDFRLVVQLRFTRSICTGKHHKSPAKCSIFTCSTDVHVWNWIQKSVDNHLNALLTPLLKSWCDQSAIWFSGSSHWAQPLLSTCRSDNWPVLHITTKCVGAHSGLW